ncbi:LysM peptidoglycan-binding domain-containing protein [Winogradskyella echinorum]|uniref:LysM peptidoglycan-binding domain-containing protein n=1 Tax=Winogradskyella echinorum TaxID=538189 RepID=A0ABR6Y509_9FLAO|nr:LysM peptidoglycan-binding domain-containing protein [Winogradskyella echinorum]MBC3847827.1 LysM peptidoglycan-binding domain-containing protein [Winogradskyella echinorum]MBC5752175.1 LysM peptidoglycan-binding domain-containing protein [Winogradskyella echinorum]
MQKNCKLIASIVVVLLSGLLTYAQEVEYKDVILDGKPAKLNVATGKITLVSELENKVVKAKKDSVKVKIPVIVTDKSIIGASNASADKLNTETSGFYVVKEGETLFDISKKYNVSLTELKRINNLETTLINKGQKLRIRDFDSDESSVENTVSYNNANFHIVEKGETLYSLAKRYSLSVNELKSRNSLNTNLIKVGQKLRVKKLITNDGDPHNWVWIVEKGDTLFSIAKKSRVSIATIKQLNGLTSNNIMIGQILRLK